MKPLRLFAAIPLITIALTWVGVFGSVNPVLANSCKCWQINDSSMEVRWEDLSVCKKDISPDDCKKRQGKLQAEFKTMAAAKCIAYRDEKCKEEVGEVDVSSVINPCWTEQECKDYDGDWAKTDSPECKSLGEGEKYKTRRCFIKPPSVTLQLAIPGLADKACSNDTSISCEDNSKCKAPGKCRPVIKGGFPGYIAKFYTFFVGAMAVFSVVMIMWAGFKRIMAAGNSETIKASNDSIFGALIGLVLVLISYTLLNLINPELVNNSQLKIDKVKTQLFGNWCPDHAEGDTKKIYYCGDQVTVNGATCTGRVCEDGKGGCYKIGNSNEVDLYTQRSKDYKCAHKWQLCGEINDDNIEEMAPGSKEDAGDDSIFTSACAKYSDNYGKCLWSESDNFGNKVILAGTAVAVVGAGVFFFPVSIPLFVASAIGSVGLGGAALTV